jgi:hypothetical protein
LQKQILDALSKIPQASAFAELLVQGPGVFQLLNPDSNHSNFVPSNEAVARYSIGLQRRDGQGGYSPEVALSFVDRGNTDDTLSSRPRTLKTVVKDPRYANLGPDEPVKVVSLPTDQGDPNRPVKIVSGMGNSVTVIEKAVPFEGGDIMVSDG